MMKYSIYTWDLVRPLQSASSAVIANYYAGPKFSFGIHLKYVIQRGIKCLLL